MRVLLWWIPLVCLGCSGKIEGDTDASPDASTSDAPASDAPAATGLAVRTAPKRSSTTKVATRRRLMGSGRFTNKERGDISQI